MNGFIRKLMRRKNRLHHKAKTRNRAVDWERFRIARNRVITEVRKAKRDFDSKLDSKVNTESGTKSWWRMVKKYIKTNSSSNLQFPPVMANGTVLDQEIDIANAFNEYFTDQSQVDDPYRVMPNLPILCENTLDNLELTEAEVRDMLLSLDVGKAKGPDNISNRLLKSLAGVLTKPLLQLFNTSLQLSCFPDIWKFATVRCAYS